MERIKKHISDHKQMYIGVGAGAGLVLAGITCVKMRGCSPWIQHSSNVLVQHSSNVLGKTEILNNVSYFSADRQGPPSWVVRCIETGEIWASQAKAATDLDIHPANLSKHLRGSQPDVNGLTFERICMAA